jgi:hypothetical protein
VLLNKVSDLKYRITRKDTIHFVYIYAKSENSQMALHVTLPCAWVGPAKVSRVVMMIAGRHSIQNFLRREDFPLLIVKLDIVSILFFPQKINLKIYSCGVIFTSFASTSLKYNFSLTSKKTFLFVVRNFTSHSKISDKTRKINTYIYTIYFNFFYPTGCSIISVGYEDDH